ncbi:c-type cytochrome [Aquabacterium humicola]|uniref:c-type cytochrome n=1 Tax=Aquabacterium humicola TaxID=3237377 RepID=UPI0025439EED|nr:cytochrome c [Rubrivivax pictus]
MKRPLLALAVAAASLPAAAQFQKPEDAIKYRQSAFTVMANHFGRVAAMAQGRVPFDAKVAADNTAIVVTMSKLPYAGFGDGTDKGLPNRAKPEIWKEQAKFNDLAGKMQAEVAKLDAAARSGSLDAVKAAVGAVGGSCKACHDDYRAEKYSN